MTTKNTVRLRAIDATAEQHATDDLRSAARRLAEPTTGADEWAAQLCALVRARARLTGAPAAGMAAAAAGTLARLM
jgi:hypothetical protein